jgi:hypothetical protein
MSTTALVVYGADSASGGSESGMDVDIVPVVGPPVPGSYEEADIEDVVPTNVVECNPPTPDQPAAVTSPGHPDGPASLQLHHHAGAVTTVQHVEQHLHHHAAPAIDLTATFASLQQWSGTYEEKFQALIGELTTKFQQVDAAMKAHTALPPDALPARLAKLEAKHKACKKFVRERVARLEARADAMEQRLGLCEEVADKARVRSLATTSSLTLV